MSFAVPSEREPPMGTRSRTSMTVREKLLWAAFVTLDTLPFAVRRVGEPGSFLRAHLDYRPEGPEDSM